jgi:fatty acid desaturase
MQAVTPVKPERINGKNVQWFRPKLAREDLAMLNQRSDVKGFVQSIGFLGVLCATGSLFVWTCFHAIWFAFPMLLLHGSCCAFLINGFHELVHDSVFKTKKLNRFFLIIYSFLGWYNHVGFWASHQEHHKFTLHPPDDLEYQPTSITLIGVLKSGIIDLKGLSGVIPMFLRVARGRLNGEWEEYLFTELRKDWRSSYHRWARIVLVGHFLILVISVAIGFWPLAIAVSFSRWFGSGLHGLVNGSQHIGLPKEYPDFRACCRTITLNPFLQFMYWNMNYHTEHHMFAGVPCYNLPKLHRLIKHELPYSPHGIRSTYAQIKSILDRRASDPGFEYWQELPNGATSYGGVSG